MQLHHQKESEDVPQQAKGAYYDAVGLGWQGVRETGLAMHRAEYLRRHHELEHEIPSIPACHTGTEIAFPSSVLQKGQQGMISSAHLIRALLIK